MRSCSYHWFDGVRPQRSAMDVSLQGILLNSANAIKIVICNNNNPIYDRVSADGEADAL